MALTEKAFLCVHSTTCRIFTFKLYLQVLCQYKLTTENPQILTCFLFVWEFNIILLENDFTLLLYFYFFKKTCWRLLRSLSNCHLLDKLNINSDVTSMKSYVPSFLVKGLQLWKLLSIKLLSLIVLRDVNCRVLAFLSTTPRVLSPQRLQNSSSEQNTSAKSQWISETSSQLFPHTSYQTIY